MRARHMEQARFAPLAKTRGDITDVPRMEIGGKYTTTNRFLVNASYSEYQECDGGLHIPLGMAEESGFPVGTHLRFGRQLGVVLISGRYGSAV